MNVSDMCKCKSLPWQCCNINVMCEIHTVTAQKLQGKANTSGAEALSLLQKVSKLSDIFLFVHSS